LRRLKKLKKIIKLAVFVLVFTLLAVYGAAQGQATDAVTRATPAEESPTIVFVTPAAEHGWLAGVIYFAEQRAAQLRLENFRLITSVSVGEQASQLDELIGQNVDAIVLMPHTFELALAANNVIRAGIPLVVFNRYVEMEYDAYLAGSNPTMGQESARIIGNMLEGSGRVAVLHVPSAGSTSVVRTENFQQVMAEEFSDIVLFDITADNFTREAGLRTGSDMLVAHQHIDAIFSIDDESSMGILQAIREAGRTDIRMISGGGGAQAYFREIYTDRNIFLFTATYSPRMAGDALETAVRILNGETVERQIIIPPVIITRDNVVDWFDDDSPY